MLQILKRMFHRPCRDDRTHGPWSRTAAPARANHETARQTVFTPTPQDKNFKWLNSPQSPRKSVLLKARAIDKSLRCWVEPVGWALPAGTASAVFEETLRPTGRDFRRTRDQEFVVQNASQDRAPASMRRWAGKRQHPVGGQVALNPVGNQRGIPDLFPHDVHFRCDRLVRAGAALPSVPKSLSPDVLLCKGTVVFPCMCHVATKLG